MKEQIGYAIFEPKGVMIFPVYSGKRIAIDDFLRGSFMSWKECRKTGWTCKKVHITLKPIIK